MRYTCSVLAMLGVLCLAPAVSAEEAKHEAPHWSYDGGTGPAHWGELAKEYSACAVGQSQSPIDIRPDTAERLDKKGFVVGYKPTNVSVANNGHTIQASVAKNSGDTVTFKGGAFKLAQFHFHTPSEHTVAGTYYPMELHLVNTDAKGNITVVGVLIKEGAENRPLAKIFRKLPADAKAKPMKTKVNLSTVLPQDRKAIVYSGSLTTPPCSEHVNWIVMENPIELSKAQISAFQRLFPDNHRPVQDLNSRKINEE